MVSRGLVLVIACIGYFIALVEPPSVFNVVIFATSVLGSAFLPAYVCAVWWKKANTPGALASIIVGASTAFFWEFLEITALTTIAPMVAGVFSSTLTMILVSLITQNKYPVPLDILKLMEESAKIRPIPKNTIPDSKSTLSNEAIEIENFLRNKS